MDNDAELSDAQTAQMLHFQEFTGIDDIAVCRDVLTRHQWDLEIAIQEQLNINEGRPTMFAAAADDARAPQVLNDPYMQTTFAAVPSREDAAGAAGGAAVVPADGGPVLPRGAGLSGLLGYFVNYFFGLCYSTLTSLATTLLGIFRAAGGGGGPDDRRRIVTDPLGDVQQSIRAYTEKYGAVHPVFYQGTYAQALNDAKRELRFLAVYLHSEAPRDAAAVGRFCRGALADAAVVAFVQRNMLWWGCDVATPEGYRVAHSVGARSYPLVVVVALRQNRMMVVGRLEGGCGAEELLRRLGQVVRENEVWLSQARAERLERSLTQSLRQQQDEAYEVSLRADQEKERVKQAEAERVRAAERAAEAERQAELDRKADIARQKIELASAVPDEPAANTPESLIVLFKLPGGQRVERRFMSTDSLKDVYNFIFCHPASPDYFELTTNFPKRVLQTKDSSAEQTLQQAGVHNREVLFVNDLEA